MFELISLITFVLAIAALSIARGVRYRLGREIATLKSELKRIEALHGFQPADAFPQTDTMTAAQEMADQEAMAEMASPEPAEADVAAEDATDAQPDAEEIAAQTDEAGQPAKAARESFESRLAARWSVWVGGLALAFAGLFAVKYSIDQGLLSPQVRLSLAALFGLVLMAAGEFLRRRTTLLVGTAFRNAMIPGILTAAGALTLFGAVYVAHGIYAFIGPATAFILLCLISLVTVALSLLHGQAFAGLGLLASFVTPVLVSSSQPSPWSLFGFLSIAWLGSTLAAKIRQWRITPAIANIGLSVWPLGYVFNAVPFEVAPVALAMLVMIAGLAFIWPGSRPRSIGQTVSRSTDGAASKPGPVSIPDAWRRVIAPRHMASTVTAAFGTLLVATSFMAPDLVSTGSIFSGFIALTVALALFGAYRSYAAYPAILAALAALGGIRLTVLSTASTTGFIAAEPGTAAVYIDPYLVSWVALGLGLFFAATGIALAMLRGRTPHTVIWGGISTLTPLAIGAISFLNFGNYLFDLKHGLYGLVLGMACLATAEFAFRQSADEDRYVVLRDMFVASSWASFIFALMVMTNNMPTTIGAAVLGFAYLLVRRLRRWPSLPWGMAASALFVAGRIAWDPTIVGPEHLSTTPVLNALLPGYGVPALLLIVSAWLVRKSSDTRMRSVIEALASLFTLLTIAILVRHAMNGGVLDDSAPTLGEQAIYTLLTIGTSVTMMGLDLRQPSIVFRTGSMAVGYISMLSVLSAHYVALNPYFSGELTGSIPFFNLLLPGYLLPGLAYGGAAWFARNRRPQHYVIALALMAASLLFAYVSLSVRRVFHGPSIADWKGFLQPELYTYSAVWLLLSVILLFLGYRFRSKATRIASAVLMLITVLKVFLVDMSSLEGLFRVLSFIGLGVALIGIGRFYQAILAGLAADAPATRQEPPAKEA